MAEFIETKLYGGKVTVRFNPVTHVYFVDGERYPSVTGIIGKLDKSQALIPWAVGVAGKYLGQYVGQELTADMVEQACQQHTIKKREAADIGTSIHDWCESYIKNKIGVPGFEKLPEMPQDKAVVIGVNGFLDTIEKQKVRFISSERPVVSLKNGYVGTLDVEAEVDNELCLIDIKSSSGIYNTFGLQTAAYLKADEEESGKKYKGRWVWRVAKETEAQYIERMEEKMKKYARPFAYEPYKAFEAKYLDETNTIERDFKAFLALQTVAEWDKLTGFNK